MSPQEALNMLYGVTRRINLPAEEHDKLRAAAGVVEQAIKGASTAPAPQTPAQPDDAPSPSQ